MAVKSIIDLQVNDGAFQKFHSIFKQYEQALAKTPRSWRDVNKNIDGSLKSFNELVAAEIAALGHQKMIVQAQEVAARLTRTNADRWREIGLHTKGVAGNIKDMTGQLLKWAGLTSVFSGVIGAGGLFGITRMSEGVAAGRRGSMGIGTSYGEQHAFRNSFDRLVDSNSFLGNINEAMHSASGKASLFGVGLNRPGDLSGSTSDVALRYLERARALAKSSNPEFDAQTMQARQIGKHMTLQDFQRLRATSDDEFANLQKRYARNVGGMGVSDRDQRAYQDFTTSIDEAGSRLNAVFVRGIAPLIPGLEKLSNATIKVVEAFLASPKLKEWIDGAGKGLERFASYVGTDEFQEKVKRVVWAVGELADKIGAAVSWITGKFPGGDGGGSGGNAKDMMHARWRVGKKLAEGHFKTPEELRQDKAEGKAWWGSQLVANFQDHRDSGAPSGLRVKKGSGYVDPGLGALAKDIQDNIPGIRRFSAFNDRYHAGTNSAHTQDRAFDVTVAPGEDPAAVAERIRAELKRLGVKGVDKGKTIGGVRDEYNFPSGRSTGGHLHVETEKKVDVRVLNAAGSNVIVTSSQMSAGTVPQ